MSNNTNALDILMHHARNSGNRKRSRDVSYFPCPAGCGTQVTEGGVNDHLDRCLNTAKHAAATTAAVIGDDDGRGPTPEGQRRRGDAARSEASHDSAGVPSTPPPPSARGPPAAIATPSRTAEERGNAFSHMMQRSAAVFATPPVVARAVRRRFHLHDVAGRVTWDEDADHDRGSRGAAGTGRASAPGESPTPGGHCGASAATAEPPWSATVTIKKVQHVEVERRTPSESADGASAGEASLQHSETALELTISTSLPFVPGATPTRLVRRHSRLSVAHLKSCLQKSIRRRAPLPAVRCALELADKSWGDLLRRLPIIVLEDSTLHLDFGLLVWLMVADSKGFAPCMALVQKVMQIVFEVASCPRQDTLSTGDSMPVSKDCTLPSRISLATPTSQLFPAAALASADTTCEVLVRAMLLRAQYGGMKCDVRMLHSFAVLWLRRSRAATVPAAVADVADAWLDLPRRLHAPSRAASAARVAPLLAPPGLPRLCLTDACAAGIDFHCAPVVGALVARGRLGAALRARLPPPAGAVGTGGDWLAGQLKRMIWQYSSSVNHRRSLAAETKTAPCTVSRAVWNDVVKLPFEEYTKKFVRDRLM